MSIPPSPKQARAACPAGAWPRFSVAGVSGSDQLRGLRQRHHFTTARRKGGRA